MSARDQAAAAVIARLATAWDGALLGITVAFVAVQTWAKYRYSSNALVELRKAPCPHISDLRSLLSSSSEEKDSPSEGKLVVIRGAVREEDPVNGNYLVSHSLNEKAVIVQRTQMCLYNEGRGIFGWGLDLHTLFSKARREPHSYSCKSVPFILVEDGPWPDGLVHVELDGATQPLPLTTVSHQLHPYEYYSSSLFRALFSNGLPVAILDEEKILPVGKRITAIGICSLQNGTLGIKSSDKLPFFLSEMKKDEIEAELSFNTSILFWSGMLLGSLSVGILGFSLLRSWQRWKEWRRVRRQAARMENNAEESAEDDEELGDVPDGQLCVVCLARRRMAAFTPCGHLACCPRCARMVERETSPKCPLCRQGIITSIRIYNS